MSEYMYVVTYPELGWDCVIGIFTTEDRAKEFCNGRGDYVICRTQVNPENED